MSTKLILNNIEDVLNALNNPETISDLPEFKTFPAGAYKFELTSVEVKDMGKDGVVRPAISIILSNAQVIELQGQESIENLQEVIDEVTGGQFYKAYFTQAKDSNEASRDMSAFKKHWIPLIQQRGETAEQFIESVAAATKSESPLEVLVMLSKTKGKTLREDGSVQYFNNIETLALAE